jgi:cytochrome c peroxidase
VLTRDATYRRMFQDAYGSDIAGDLILDALAAFQSSIPLGVSRAERFIIRGDSNALSELERDGWKVFLGRGGCAGCHVPVRPVPGRLPILFLSDDRFHNLGVGYESGRWRDSGRVRVSGIPEATGAFKTPSLRNVGATAPYMHDGSLLTLEEVVRFYNEGGIDNPYRDGTLKPRSLTSEESGALVAFLRALDAEALQHDATMGGGVK